MGTNISEGHAARIQGRKDFHPQVGGEATDPLETFVPIYQTTQSHNSEDRNLGLYRR